MDEVKVESFLEFLDKCITPYQFCDYAKTKLLKSNYQELFDEEEWDSIPDKGFVIRDGTALIAFQIDKSEGMPDSMIIVGTHDDSPCLQVSDIYFDDTCNKAYVSKYGGGQWYTWFDRDLRLAGRVFVEEPNGTIIPVLFDSVEPIGICPSSSFSNDVNVILNTLNDPITGTVNSPDLFSYITNKLNITPPRSISSWELRFLDAAPARSFSSLVCSGRIDNLGSTFAGLTAFLNSKPNKTVNILVVFDNEEIGSSTNVGALGDFLSTTVGKIFKEKKDSVIAKSLLISADNAHAIHPSYPEKHEEEHSPLIGHGLVIKKSPGSSYATDLVSEYPLRQAAKVCGVKLQELINRNDIRGGSTIGPLASTLLGIPTVDVGQPQLAMHSACETVSFNDVKDNIKIFEELYNNYLQYRIKL